MIDQKEENDINLLKLNKLRKQAEDKAGELKNNPEESKEVLSLLHELRVHQIELEMQNEELKIINNELKRVNYEEKQIKEQYLELYDFAPIGYFTVALNGIITKVNFTATNLYQI